MKSALSFVCYINTRQCYINSRQCYITTRQCYINKRQCYINSRQCYNNTRKCYTPNTLKQSFEFFDLNLILFHAFFFRGTGKNDSFHWLFHEGMWSRRGRDLLVQNHVAEWN